MFRGHDVRGLLENVIHAAFSYIFLQELLTAIKHQRWLVTVGLGVVFLLCLPRLTYLFLEIKHLLFNDGVADERDPIAILVFLGLSLSGLVGAVIVILMATHRIPILNQNPSAAIVLLSCISSFGTVVGLLDVTLRRPGRIVKAIPLILASWKWLGFTLGLGFFLTTVCLGVEALLF